MLSEEHVTRLQKLCFHMTAAYCENNNNNKNTAPTNLYMFSFISIKCGSENICIHKYLATCGSDHLRMW